MNSTAETEVKSRTNVAIVIEPVQKSDAEAILQIEAVSFPGRDRWGVSSSEQEDPLYQTFVARAGVTRDGSSDEGPTLAAEGGSSLVGYVGTWTLGEELHITSLAVDPRWRKGGIGRSLMVHALRFGQKQGAARASLDVRRGNQAALRLYRSLGFVVLGVRPAYYLDNGEDALVMWVNDLWGPENYFRLRRAAG